jgi:HPt (histidine-containing phosphotransfer) domain-containing protein
MFHSSRQDHQPAGAIHLAPALLDSSALERLQALDPSGKAGVVKRVFQAYATSLSRLMAQLNAARTAGDLTAVRHVAHTLKSSSASIGALAFSSRCSELESMVRQQQCDGIDDCLDALVAESAKVSAAVQAMLAA